MSKFAMALQTFLAKKPSRSLLISTLDKIIYYKGTFYRAQQNLSLQHKIGWRPAEKKSPLFSS
jgi:hypothetical protein